jgi:hypothetical protein
MVKDTGNDVITVYQLPPLKFSMRHVVATDNMKVKSAVLR